MKNGRKKREDGRKARTIANRKYNEKAYDRIEINVIKGQKDIVKNRASENGQSVGEYINSLIAKDIADFQPIGVNPYLKK